MSYFPEEDEIVWVTQTHYCFAQHDVPPEQWKWELGRVVRIGPLRDEYGRPTAQWWSVRLGDHRVIQRGSKELRRYNAVDQLADLVRCTGCRDHGRQECPKHQGIYYMDAVVAATSNDITFDCDAIMSTCLEPGPDQALHNPRRSLTLRERQRRRLKTKAAKRSRAKNRGR